MFTKDDREFQEELGKDVNALFAKFYGLEERVNELCRHERELKDNFRSLVQVVNNNSKIGQQLDEIVADAEDRLAAVKEAVDLLALSMGKEIRVQAAVPVTITLTPGEPEKLVLVKAPKQKALPKPEPITIEVPSVTEAYQELG